MCNGALEMRLIVTDVVVTLTIYILASKLFDKQMMVFRGVFVIQQLGVRPGIIRTATFRPRLVDCLDICGFERKYDRYYLSYITRFTCLANVSGSGYGGCLFLLRIRNR